MERLNGHISPETAYVVNDYPYAYSLRCKSRYWIEERRGFGIRFVSQTTNPKKSGDSWNRKGLEPIRMDWLSCFSIVRGMLSGIAVLTIAAKLFKSSWTPIMKSSLRGDYST